MLNTVMELRVLNGIVLETYSVEQDCDGAIFLRNVLDSEIGAPVDMMHIDVAAAVPIARALLLAAGRAYVNTPIHTVVAFPMGGV